MPTGGQAEDTKICSSERTFPFVIISAELMCCGLRTTFIFAYYDLVQK